MLNALFPKLFSMMQSGGRSSVMKPILYVMVCALIGLWISPSEIVVLGMALKAIMGVSFVATLFVAVGAYVFYSYKNPRLLQSEHYQLAMRKMDLATQRIGTEPTFVEGSNTDGIAIHDTVSYSNKNAKLILTGTEVSEDESIEGNV